MVDKIKTFTIVANKIYLFLSKIKLLKQIQIQKKDKLKIPKNTAFKNIENYLFFIFF